jgi:hypothetical protein
LRWATSAENAADKIVHGTHMEGSNVPRAKLTEDQVLNIKLELKSVDRRKFEEIAEEYGVTASAIGGISQGITWKHVDIENGVVGVAKPRRSKFLKT